MIEGQKHCLNALHGLTYPGERMTIKLSVWKAPRPWPKFLLPHRCRVTNYEGYRHTPTWIWFGVIWAVRW